MGRNGSQRETPESQKPRELQGFATTCESLHARKVPPLGLEPRTR